MINFEKKFLMSECQIVRHPVILVPEWHRSHTGIRGPSPVPNPNRPDRDAGCRNGDAGSVFDADAYLSNHFLIVSENSA
jgi:hypothetical protein